MSLPGLSSSNAGLKSFGTFQLSIVNIPRVFNRFAVQIPDILSVGKIWLNGISAGETRIIGTDINSKIPFQHSLYVEADSISQQLDIVIQVSGFHNARGGLNEPMWFGKPLDINEKVTIQKITTAALGAVLFFSVYLTYSYFFRAGRKRPGVGLLIPGFILIILITIVDILTDFNINHNGSLLVYGIVGFIIFYSFLEFIKLSRSFAAVKEKEVLKHELDNRRKRENSPKMKQGQLAGILDNIDDAVPA